MAENKNKAGVIFLLILLLGSLGINLFQWKNNETIVINSNQEVDSLISSRIDVERELASIEMELEKYRGITHNLDSLLLNAGTEIQAQETKIRNLIASEKNMAVLNRKLKDELLVLKKSRDEYLEKIDAIMAENATLKKENIELSNKLNIVTDDKNILEKKVNTASQLGVEYVNVLSFKKKNNGKFTESLIAKRTNKIEACFTIMDNKVAPTGDKLIYLRVVSPIGKPLMGFSKATLTDFEGKQVEATSSQMVNYTGEKQNICLAYENEERILESGTYLIEIYVENRLVHQSNYILK